MFPLQSRQVNTVHSSMRKLVCRIRNRLRWPESSYLLNMQRRFLYCPIQKIACSSLMRAFLGTHGLSDEQITDPHDQVLDYQLGRLPAGQAIRILENPAFFTFSFVRNPWARLVSAYLNLLMSRNPVSEPVLRHVHIRRGRRGAPEIRPGHQTDITFAEFLDFLAGGNPRKYNVHWKPQVLFFRGNRLDFVGRFERLENDFEVIRERLGIDATLPRVNSTKYIRQETSSRDLVADWSPQDLLDLPALPKYRQFYTPEMSELVAQIYAQDIEAFGYTPEN